VDVVYRRLSDWTRLQWALYMQRASPFSAVMVATHPSQIILRFLVN